MEETLSPVLQEPLAGAAAVNNTGGILELLWIKRRCPSMLLLVRAHCTVHLSCIGHLHKVRISSSGPPLLSPSTFLKLQEQNEQEICMKKILKKQRNPLHSV